MTYFYIHFIPCCIATLLHSSLLQSTLLQTFKINLVTFWMLRFFFRKYCSLHPLPQYNIVWANISEVVALLCTLVVPYTHAAILSMHVSPGFRIFLLTAMGTKFSSAGSSIVSRICLIINWRKIKQNDDIQCLLL